MLCTVCLHLDFKYLKDWQTKLEEIRDSKNHAFRSLKPSYPSEGEVAKCVNGGQALWVHCFHHKCLSALIASARQGCHLCALMLNSLFRDPHPVAGTRDPPESYELQPIVLSILARPSRPWYDAPIRARLHLYCGCLHSKLTIMDALESSFGRYSVELEGALIRGSINDYLSTWSDFNVRLAYDWYQRCNREHPGCKIGNEILPKRVIDIGNGDEECQPLLVEPEPQSCSKYTILSHCWGDIRPLETVRDTTRSNLWHLPPLTQWPRTFQDAVRVTRSFKIQYLWIDSCCILQGPGNRADWEIESAKMAQYFRNASFTIAAIFATSGKDGLFSERNPLMTSPLRINFEPLANRRPARTMYLCADTDAWRQIEVEDPRWDAPLHTRGWVLQEEALSPRALEFGQRRISWNCLSSFWSELRPSGISQPYRQAGDNLPIKLLIHSDPNLVPGRNRKYDTWYDVINKINHRDIKYQDDILPAISGIAESFLPVVDRNDRYLAGLWKNDLAVGLLWCTAAFHSGRSRRPLPDVNYVTGDFWAPSWSWVFLSHKRVLIGLHETTLYARRANNTGSLVTRLTSTSITLHNSLAPYGIVTSGILSFLARCPRVTIFCNESVRVDNKIQQLEIPPYPINGQLFPKRIEVHNSYAFHRSSPQETTAGLISGDALLDDTEVYEVPPYVDITPPPKRPTTIISAIFLPLLNHSFEIGDQGCPIHEPIRTMGLLLQPIESHNGESPHQSCTKPSRTTKSLRLNMKGPIVESSRGQDPQGRSQHFYRRIGRGSLNMHENDWKDCDLPFEEINII